MRYDAVVIGTGPAGLEAALNLKIRNKNFLLFGRAALSKKVAKAPLINNYLGLPGKTGAEMIELFLDHLRAMDITVSEETVSTVYPMGDYYAIATGHNTYEATTVILCTGVAPTSFFQGEQRLLGHGVGYCATCDAPLYRGKTVAVLGYGDEAVAETNFIAEICGKTYYVPLGSSERPLDARIEVVKDKVAEIAGESKVEFLVLKNRTLPVDGVFILRDTIAPMSLLPGLQVEDGFIAVDFAMATNLSGVFAAGDCTGKPHQYIRAAGQGLIAAHSAVAYLDQGKKE